MFGSIERALIQVSYAETNKRLRKPYFSTDCLFGFFFTSHFVCLQNNCMSQPVVYLDNMLDHELASKLTTIIAKHQVIC